MFGGIPFGFGGGMPFEGGGMGGGGDDSDEDVDTEGYYKALNVSKDATKKEIKKAFLKIAQKEHPDKGGDPEKFKVASEAYEVLFDERKRKIYDEYGKAGVERAKDGGDGSKPSMASMFGFGGGGGRGPRKTKDQVFPVHCTLEKLAKGHTAKFAVTRDTLCTDCRGSGTKDGASERKCEDCGGHGVVIIERRMGPMVQRMQAPCDECRGKGKVISDEDKCGTCRGNHVAKSREVLEVHVEPGMKHGQKIVKRGMADEAPGAEPGDIIFVIQQKEHDRFVRREADLIMKKEITLTEALTGTKFVVKHPDGRSLLVKSAPGEVFAEGDVKAVAEGGMPQHGSPYSRGNLFVKFSIQMPKSLNTEATEMIAKSLPEDEPDMVSDDMDHYELREVDLKVEAERRKNIRAHMDATAEDSDDEDMRGAGGQRVQCASQ